MLTKHISLFAVTLTLVGLFFLVGLLSLRWRFLRRARNVVGVLCLVQAGRDVMDSGWIGNRFSALDRILDFLFLFLLGALLITLVKDLLLHWFARRKVVLSKLVRDVTTWVLYVVWILFIITAVYDISVTPFLAGSAVLTVVLGLAVQDTLINLFAGVVFHFEDSIRLGDWLEVSDQVGEVKEMSWRAIRMVSVNNEVFVIPNQDFTKKPFTNLTRTDAARTLVLGVSYRDDPEKVMRTLLRAALSTPGVRWEPKPDVRITGFGDSAVTYRIRYLIENYRDHVKTQGNLLLSIWHAFERHRITIPYPVQVVHVEGKLENPVRHDETETVREALADLEMFRFLEGDEMDALVRSSELSNYPDGAVVMLEGEVGTTMCVIVEGGVAVIKDGRSLAELGAGEVFGEIALFTGEARKATVKARGALSVVVIHKDGFEEILRSNALFIRKIERMVEERLEAAAGDTGNEQKNEVKKNILGRIRNYFLAARK